jgi:predicted RNA binding protein with dsRBD fold (UPF0201 family)
MSQPEFGAKVMLEATISPSEDPLKVAGALANVIGSGPDAVEFGQDSARLLTRDPRALRLVKDRLRDRHVRSAARRQLLVKKSAGSSSLMLNRQAASAGVIALCGTPEESPLGPIYLSIRSDKLDAVIDWLTSYDVG